MDRSLRSGTRKDYKLMASGEDRDEETEKDELSERESNDVYNSEKETSDGGIVSPTEEDVELLERQVADKKILKKKLEKENKLRQLSKEMRNVEKLIQQHKKRRSRSGRESKAKHQVTAGSLRSMSEVQDEVERLMNKNLGLNKLKIGRRKTKSKRRNPSLSSSQSESYSDSSESSQTDESSETSSSESSDGGRKSRKSRRKSKKSKTKGKKSKKSSGKNRKMTSYVKYPQEWPHSNLSLHFISEKKMYEQLTIEEFCAGYATILENVKDGKVRKYRIQHFKELMYLSTRYNWTCVLDYHAACLLEIERGYLQWGDSFQSLQITTLAGGFLPQHTNGRNGSVQHNRNRNGGDGPIMFCRNYQRGTCSESDDHFGDFNGTQRFLRHICATCWLSQRKKAPHPENSDDCPFNKD